ncbi:MAG TPA: bestrophin family ion channel [Cyclobacteriaceae bacterium]|nr:bestrophin family ion channel [Cyclobacteriaceae bacterium]
MLLKKNIPWTYVLSKVKYEILLVICYTVVFVRWHEDLNLHHITIPITIPAIIGTIISLLLAFRSNQAYDRWWEARIIWGSIVNDSRTLIRQMKTFINDPEFSITVDKITDTLAMRQVFWTYSLGQSLRNQDPMKLAEKFLSDEDLKFVSKHTHIPNALLMLHGQDIKSAMEQGLLNSYQQVELDRTISRLCDAMGKCERIKNTIFPTTYSLYIHFALYLFIIILPFGLTEYLGIVQAPIMILIPLSFLLIEKMAIHFQDPFENKPTDTPMTSIAVTIEKNLREMIRDNSSAKIAATQKVESTYYQL